MFYDYCHDLLHEYIATFLHTLKMEEQQELLSSYSDFNFTTDRRAGELAFIFI